jgi:uncharacterized protein (TIGR02145 family)
MTIVRLKTVRTLLFAAALSVAAVCWLGCGDKVGGNNDPDAVVGLPEPVDADSDTDYDLDGIDSLPPGYYWNTVGDSGLDRASFSAYTVIDIGGKMWQKHNVQGGVAPGWYCYDNAKGGDPECYGGGKGGLYKWQDAKKACENLGMRLPTVADWKALIKATGGDIAGFHLKEYSDNSKCFFGCNSPWHVTWSTVFTWKVCSDDAYHFTAQPGGWREPNGKYNAVGYYGYWWTADRVYYSDSKRYAAYVYHMGWDYDDVQQKFYWEDGQAYSVRCVKDY